MKANKTSYDQLPIILNANAIAQTLGISRAGAYELMHSEGFPTLRIGKRMMVSKEHFIQWITIVYNDTVQRITLEAGQAPEATFCVCNAAEVDVYAYCNLHGLWKSTVKK